MHRRDVTERTRCYALRGGAASLARRRSMSDVRMRGFRARTKIADALALLSARTGALESELALVEDAAGRVAAEDVAALVDVPHFARAAMDGYAVRAASTAGATEGGAGEARGRPERSLPGRPFRRRSVGADGEAVRVATRRARSGRRRCGRDGGSMPRSTTIVVRVLAFDRAAQAYVGASSAKTSVAGARVVIRGRRLRPQDLGVLASTWRSLGSTSSGGRGSRFVITGDEILLPKASPRRRADRRRQRPDARRARRAATAPSSSPSRASPTAASTFARRSSTRAPT